MAKYEWVDFYKEFAERLMNYKNNRLELIQLIAESYKIIGISLPKLEATDKPFVEIDPFTTMGLFNKSSMTQENRIKILSQLGNAIGVKIPVPKSFDGVPTLNNQNATFYGFLGYDNRGEDDIDNLWNLMDYALQYAKNPDGVATEKVKHYFDLVIQKKGNGNSKVTMGLYWIAPEAFLNLDSRNEWYIYESGKIPAEIVKDLPKVEIKIASARYFKIIEGLRNYIRSSSSELNDFIDLSFEAWKYSQEVNNEQKKIVAQRDNTGAALADNGVDTIHYWIYSPGNNAMMWESFYDAGIMAIGWGEIGDLKLFDSKYAMKQAMKDTLDASFSYKNAAHATWQFANEMKPGDVIFVKKGMHQLIGRGIVASDYFYDSSREDEYNNVRKVDWTHKGEWNHPGQAVMKTLTDITQYTDYVEKLNALFSEDTPTEIIDEKEIEYPAYTAEDFLSEVYMEEEDYRTLVGVLKNKKNIIIQGAPGVGKTFAAKRLAYSIMGKKDKNRVMMVQFHQSYSYEDFIMGFRPSETGFELKKGAFYNFCKEAEIDSDNEYFFIIDEINRGNLSKIFGELFMLIETDKRGLELQLLYSDEKFSVPSNVYIIGMMNTADRSLAMLDYALRRRFAFINLQPGFETDGFRKYRMELQSEKFDKLITCVENLNHVIETDESLGEGFCIGHSYFCNLKSADDQTLRAIVEFELVPLLKEYWFDEPTKVRDWSGNLRSAIK